MEIRKSGTVAQVMPEDEVIEEFESCGCIYRDLGTCQGCPVCKFASENNEPEPEDVDIETLLEQEIRVRYVS